MAKHSITFNEQRTQKDGMKKTDEKKVMKIILCLKKFRFLPFLGHLNDIVEHTLVIWNGR